jgi:uncharacterized cupredoxin-like copper-binding protein/mono/diheme cytochrome c family protein
VGAVRRLATVVMVGLVALSTVLVLYLFDEPNRQAAEEETQMHIAVERGTALYLQYCMSCHGPAGEGYLAAGERGTGRIGMPIGGNTDATILNQTAVNAQGTPFKGGMEGRYDYLHHVLVNGRGAMPAWGEELNGEQIHELTVFMQHVDWNMVYNEAVYASGGYPTPPPGKSQEPAPAPATDAAGDTGAQVVVDMGEMYFQPMEIKIPANTAVTILGRNVGVAPHNFELTGQGVSVDFVAGEEKLIDIPALPAGEYEFICNVPGHKEAGMVGKLIVEEGYEFPAAASAASDTASGDDAGDAAADGGDTFTLGVLDIYFEPADFEIAADTEVTIVLDGSAAAAPHNFAIDSENISVDVAPGEVKEVKLMLKPGVYDYYCNVPGHKEAGMVGKITVK